LKERKENKERKKEGRKEGRNRKVADSSLPAKEQIHFSKNV